MKNKSLVLVISLIGIFTSCASKPHKDETRAIASQNFECSFSDLINGKNTQFVFTPESLKLSVNNEIVALEEDNFIDGGFSYVMNKNEKVGVWAVKKIEFLSFTTKPQVTVHFSRTPASKRELKITHQCD